MAGETQKVFSRIQGLFETEALAQKTVCIIGLGTGGSMCAVELAKCAVGRFILVDFDKLELHNIARHACGLSDLGRLKTEAVRDAIRNINPSVEIDCINIDVLSDARTLDGLLLDSDIVLPCTDTEKSKYLINQRLMRIWFSSKISIPAVYAGAYERAFGGDVMRVVPGLTPCYECVVGAVQKMDIWQDRPKSQVAYTDMQSSNQFTAEPGLGMDVHFLALIQSKMALLTMLRGQSSTLEDIEYDFILWGNRREWIFQEPFKCIFARIERRADCTTCGADSLNRTVDQENQDIERVHELLKALPRRGKIDES